MSLQFYLGASGSGKSYKLYNDVNEWARNNKDKNYLFIVPDQFTMQAQRNIVEASKNHGIMNIDVLSFNRLAYRVFEETGFGKQQVLDDTGKSLVLRALASKYEKKMPVLGANINKIGYIHEIKSIISEFKEYDITTEKLDEIINSCATKNMLSQKLKDIKVIYDAFNDYMRDDFITSEETLALLTQAIDHSAIVKGATIILDGFTGFTPVQYRFIQHLLELTDKVIVSVTIDINSNPYKISGEQELFYLSKKTIQDLQNISQMISIKQDDDVVLNTNYRFINNAELGHLEKSLFRYPIMQYEYPTENIRIIENTNIYNEISNICIKIKDLVLDKNYRYKDIAVICGDISAYADGFKAGIDTYGIPFFIDQNQSITLNPFIEFIKSALMIIKEDFSYETVFHMLKSGLSDFEEHEINEFDNYILSCGIRGYKKYSQLFTKIKGLSDTEGEISLEDVEYLNNINAIRERLIDSLAPLIGKFHKTSDYTNAIRQYISQNGILCKLDNYVEIFLSENNPEKAQEYRQIYSLVNNLLDEIDSILKDEEMTLAEFIKIFEAGIDEIDVGKIPGGFDRVLVGDIERSRIANVKVLILVGANDGNIPRNNSKGGIISDVDREFLSSKEVVLSKTPREQIFIQRLYLYLNMTKPTDRLYISYSKQSQDGKALKESYLISMIKKMFPMCDTECIKDRNDLKSLIGYKDGVKIFAENIRKSIYEKKNDELIALGAILCDNQETRELTKKIIETACYRYKPVSLSKDLARELYGTILYGSVSRLELYARCQYEHFLKYGIGLSKRDEFEFKAYDLGNIYHRILEGFSDKLSQKGYTFIDFPVEETKELLNDVITSVTVKYGAGILYSSAKSEYMVERIFRIMERSVLTLRTQLEGGLFTPEGYEEKFSFKVDVSDDLKMRLNGRIDRFDVLKKDEKLYIKVIDFKSNKKDLELDSLLYGLQIQQPVYMEEAIRLMSEKYKELMPKMAAMLYYHIDDPYVFAEDDAEIDKQILRELRPSGLISDDREIVCSLDTSIESKGKSDIIPVELKNGEFTSGSKIISKEEYETISDFVNESIKRTAISIAEGNKKINPYEKDGKRACEYCDYKDICAFDDKIDGFSFRKLKKLDKDTALERMKESN